MIYASGNVYKGGWSQGIKHGAGKMVWSDTNQEYQGEWRDGKPNGQGVYIWRLDAVRDHQYPMMNSYTGSFIDGQRHGYGSFQYANGSRYEGYWSQNLKHGKAKYYTENGRQYIGSFVNDRTVVPFSRFDNDVPFVFKIDSFVAAGKTIESTLKDVNAVLFRHIAEIRKIYHHYCRLSQQNSAEPRNLVSQDAMWLLYKDMKLTQQGVTLADIDRAAGIVFKDDPCFSSRYTNPHNSHGEFILHQFIEILVLVAHHLYRNSKERSIHESGVAASFAHLVKHDLLPNARGLSEQTQLSDEARASQELFDEFYSTYRQKIATMYTELATTHPKALPESGCDKTVTIREFLLMLKEYKILDNVFLTIPKIISPFTKDYPFVFDAGSYNLEHELVPRDLFGGLMHFAVIAAKESISKPSQSTKPSTPTRPVLDHLSPTPPVIIENEERQTPTRKAIRRQTVSTKKATVDKKGKPLLSLRPNSGMSIEKPVPELSLLGMNKDEEEEEKSFLITPPALENEEALGIKNPWLSNKIHVFFASVFQTHDKLTETKRLIASYDLRKPYAITISETARRASVLEVLPRGGANFQEKEA